MPRTRPRVLITGPSATAVSGITTHVQTLMAAPRLASFELLHFEAGSEGKNETPIMRAIRLFLSPLLFAWTVLRSGARIAHINTSFHFRSYWRDLCFLIVAKILRVRVLYQVHGGSLPARLFNRSQILRTLARWALYWPDVVVVLTKEEAAAYKAFVPRQRILRIPNGVDAAPYRSLSRDRDGARPLTLLCLGRIVANKGVFCGVQALGVLRARGINVRLVIAGDGPDEPAVRQRVHALALEGHVNFVGAVQGRQKLDVIAKADVFLLPTFHLEGIPYALLETMAAGVVPVATQIGGIPDVVTDGIHGFLIPPQDAVSLANAVESLATNSQKLSSMSDADRERISAGFPVAKTVSRIRRIYDVLYPARHRRPVVIPAQVTDA